MNREGELTVPISDDHYQTIEHEGVVLRVIPMDQHDRRCDVRVASRQDTTPPVLHCHFCGFCYPPVTSADDQAPDRADPTQPRPFEELVDLVGVAAAGEMLEAAAPAVREAGADIQTTGAILLAAVRGLQAAGHMQLTVTPSVSRR